MGSTASSTSSPTTRAVTSSTTIKVSTTEQDDKSTTVKANPSSMTRLISTKPKHAPEHSTSSTTLTAAKAYSKGCETMCTIKERELTCEQHVQQQAIHQFLNSENACELAHDVVMRECAHCSSCSLSKTHCALDVPSASHNYDCKAELDHWQRRWSLNKKRFCCQHSGEGCPSHTTSLPYDCNDGFSTWEKAWSSEKKAWCCHSRDRG